MSGASEANPGSLQKKIAKSLPKRSLEIARPG
jgi:hypothetical protein